MLPIFDLKAPLHSALTSPKPPSLLIKAPTGSGKSTQIPQLVLDSGCIPHGQRIVILQPRRIAARMLASRVSHERGTPLGQEVGYQVRFENATSPASRIVFVTEGVLLRQLLNDPDLAHVGCLIIDEFHERHLDADLCLAWARRLQHTRRPDLRLIVMSATLIPGPLESYLHPSLLLESEGRTFPVSIRYQSPKSPPTPSPEPVWDQAARACQSLAHDPAGQGNLLVFMPGAYEIQKTIAALQNQPVAKGRLIVPMHGELTPDQQDAALQPGTRPKIIVSTNIAETSLTIEGITAVIDSGLARVASYDARRGLNTLTIQKISRASAEQRAGRAGRLGPGTAVRLWSERDHSHRAESETPEVHRLDLSEAWLALKQAEVTTHPPHGTAAPLAWFEAPPATSLLRADQLLRDLGALDPDGCITPIGQRMTRFPLHPRFSRMLLAAADEGCLREAALCAAIAQGRSILIKNRDPGSRRTEDFWEPGDLTEFQALLRAFHRAEAARFDPSICQNLGLHARASREAAASRDQFLRAAQHAHLPLNDSPAPAESLARTLLVAFSDHLGCETSRGSRVYQLPGGFNGHLSKDAHIKPPPLLVAAEMTEVQGKALQVHLSHVTQVELEWLHQLFPHDLVTGHHPTFDPIQRRVVNREETRFRQLVLSSRERGEPNPDDAAALLATEVFEGRLQLPLWNERVEQWITRVNCLARWMPELEFPTLTADDRLLVLEQVAQGCTSYRQLKNREVFPALHQWLNPMQRDLLDLYAPERIDILPDRSAKVTYDDTLPPSISVKLQHLYDINRNPTVANGTITLTVHLLSPAQRPIATTSDLATFWKEGYLHVKKDLKGRYPKHEWR